MVEQWSPKPKVKGSNPFSPEKSPVFGLFQLQRVKEKLEDVMIELLNFSSKKLLFYSSFLKEEIVLFLNSKK